jgi:hypothetical protein
MLHGFSPGWVFLAQSRAALKRDLAASRGLVKACLRSTQSRGTDLVFSAVRVREISQTLPCVKKLPAVHTTNPSRLQLNARLCDLTHRVHRGRR